MNCSKSWSNAHRLRGFDLLDQSGLLAVILPEVEALKGCEQPEQFHPEGDVFVHTRMMLGLLAPEASGPQVLSRAASRYRQAADAIVRPSGSTDSF